SRLHEQCLRNGDAESCRHLSVDHELEPGRQFAFIAPPPAATGSSRRLGPVTFRSRARRDSRRSIATLRAKRVVRLLTGRLARWLQQRFDAMDAALGLYPPQQRLTTMGAGTRTDRVAG